MKMIGKKEDRLICSKMLLNKNGFFGQCSGLNHNSVYVLILHQRFDNERRKINRTDQAW